MAKISKQDLKVQKEVQELLWSKPTLTLDETEFIYENYNPSMDDNITEHGVFFTPLELAQDFNIFTSKKGHIVDVCSGIGMLSYKLICYAYYQNNIESLTLVEYSPKFTEIAKKLISPLSAYNEDRRSFTINFVCADAYASDTWKNLISSLPLSADGKYNLMISNPPYGTCPKEYKDKYSDHLKYFGERELMAVELALKYSRDANFIIPPGSSDVQFSGRPYMDTRESRKLTRFRKVLGEDYFFKFEIDGVDTSIYKDDWKGTSILTECVSINMNRKDYE